MRHRFAPLLALLAGLWLVVAVADEDDYREARQLLAEGKILSLEVLLRSVTVAPGWRLLEVELEKDEERIVYELFYIDPEGRVRELYYDATTAQFLGEDDD